MASGAPNPQNKKRAAEAFARSNSAYDLSLSLKKQAEAADKKSGELFKQQAQLSRDAVEMRKKADEAYAAYKKDLDLYNSLKG